MKRLPTGHVPLGERILAVLAYLGPLCFIPLLLTPPSRFVRFHTNQGLVLFVVEIICGVLSVIPVIGPIVGVSVGLGMALLSVLGLIQVFQGRAAALPIVGEVRLMK